MKSKQRVILSLTAADVKRWSVFGLLSLLFFTFFFGYKATDLWLSFRFSVMLLPATIATAWYVNTILIPRYYFTKRFGWFALYLVGALIFSSWLIVATFTGAFYLVADLRLINLTPMSRDLLFVIIAVYLAVISSAVVSLLRQSNETLTNNQKLANQVLESDLKLKVQELQYLKNQLKPHFLFNSLNTLYGMALKQSEQTPDAIVKLSNLLDYVLYQPADQQVTLVRELEHIRDYTELEKIRFGDKIEIGFETIGDLTEVMLPAMLLIPFVENSFKHGGTREGKHRVQIDLKADGDLLQFEVKNYQKQTDTDKKGGIGLTNTQRRLDLLYGEQYQLEVLSEQEWFTVKLELPWKEIKEVNPISAE